MEENHSPEQLQFIAAAMSNPKVLDWLAGYGTQYHRAFLAQYASRRELWLNIGRNAVADKHHRLTRIIEQAEEILFSIQQKKLFDLQCQWRAGSATVEGLRHAAEFSELEAKIKALDFLDPISPDELQILKDYLADEEKSHRLQPFYGWQDYDHFLHPLGMEERDEVGVPAFYSYMDQRQGNISLWKVLENRRGRLEDKYKTAALMARVEAAQVDHHASPQEYDERQVLSIHSEAPLELAKLIEEHKDLECIAAHFERRAEKELGLEWELDVLMHADALQPIEANTDWKAAIRKAACKYRNSKLIAALDIVYENYNFRRQMGIGFPSEGEATHSWMNNPEVWAHEILAGREALGEPRDFNF